MDNFYITQKFYHAAALFASPSLTKFPTMVKFRRYRTHSGNGGEVIAMVDFILTIIEMTGARLLSDLAYDWIKKLLKKLR